MAEKPDNVLYEYNISSRGAPTLVGNWVEERALQQVTYSSSSGPWSRTARELHRNNNNIDSDISNCN